MRWRFGLAVLMCVVLTGTVSAQPAPQPSPQPSAQPRTPAQTQPGTPPRAPLQPGGQRQPVTIDADMLMYDAAQQVVTAQGNVRVVFRRYRLFADQARYDLRAQIVNATGRIRVVDSQQRELRGQSLVYNNQTEEGLLETAEGIVDRERRIYFRGERLDFSPDRYVLRNSVITNCDPRNPLLYIKAERVEIVPEEEAVASRATAYLGSRAVYTAQRLVVNLRPGEEGVLLPGFGSNAVDGFWVDYKSRLTLAGERGVIRLKYGFDSGFFGLLTLTHREPRRDPRLIWTLRIGSTQTEDDRAQYNLLAYDVAEWRLAFQPQKIARTPLLWLLGVGVGWFNERLTSTQLTTLGLTGNIGTTRLDGQLAVRTERIPLAPRLSYQMEAGVRTTAYGTGDVRTIPSYDVDLTYRIGPYTSVTLGYTWALIHGNQPLAIDNIDPQNTVRLVATHAVVDRYRVQAGVAVNAALAETKLTGGVAYALSRSFEVGVSGVYNTRLAAWQDLDYTLRTTCDCVDVLLRYRSVQREISIEIGLTGLGERRGLFVPRSIPEFKFPEDAR